MPTRIDVLVNRVRTSALGIDAHAQVRQTLRRFAGIADATLLPHDGRATDAAILTARTLRDAAARSPLRAAFREYALDRILPEPEPRGAARRSPVRRAAAARRGTAYDGRSRPGRAGTPGMHYAGSVSTLSDLVLAQGRSSQADVDWLHMLVGDLQLLADLAFADIVLWVPSGDDDFVAVAHARPSSAATLFYRDFVGQQIKPQWRDLVTQAFETARIVDSSAPDWYEEMPTRVRAVPVMRRVSATGTELAPEPVAVITRHTNLGRRARRAGRSSPSTSARRSCSR